MRPLTILLLPLAVTLVACAADDGAATDASEINEGRGSIERKMEPPVSTPESPLVGAKLEDVFKEALAGAPLVPGAGKKGSDGCLKTEVRDVAGRTLEEARAPINGVVISLRGLVRAQPGDGLAALTQRKPDERR